MIVLSTILNRLWVAISTPPNGVGLFSIFIILLGYFFVVVTLGARWGLVDLEPFQVWYNLQLYRYRLKLHNNRQAVKLMALLGGWVLLEELTLRVVLVPLTFEQMFDRQRLFWIIAAWTIAIGRHIFIYCRFHPFFGQFQLLVLSALLDMACLMVYFFTESLWLSILFHWLIVVFWLFLLGGRYQLQQYRDLEKQ